MKNFAKLLLLSVVCTAAVISMTVKSVFAADPGSDSATCVINVTVGQIIEWEGPAYTAIDLADPQFLHLVDRCWCAVESYVGEILAVG